VQAGKESSAGAVLGRFHEWSVPTTDILASIEFYERLGFTQAKTREVWPHPYAALTDGRIVIGLHRSPSRAASLTFVLPDVASRYDELERRGFELAYRRTGAEVFHEIGLLDPSGQRVVLLEARTYSPADRGPETTSRCGYFCALGLPAAHFDAARRFWEPLGFVAAAELAAPYPHVRLTSDHLNIVLHRPRMHAGPLLIFADDDAAARVAHLRDLGIEPRRLPAGAGVADHALLEAPEGTRLLLLGAEI
jgi:catechol 2,3-dioxygenase-like lactoylglutathione lyase family enzyme